MSENEDSGPFKEALESLLTVPIPGQLVTTEIYSDELEEPEQADELTDWLEKQISTGNVHLSWATPLGLIEAADALVNWAYRENHDPGGRMR